MPSLSARKRLTPSPPSRQAVDIVPSSAQRRAPGKRGHHELSPQRGGNDGASEWSLSASTRRHISRHISGGMSNSRATGNDSARAAGAAG